jgi:hypothetical protein
MARVISIHEYELRPMRMERPLSALSVMRSGAASSISPVSSSITSCRGSRGLGRVLIQRFGYTLAATHGKSFGAAKKRPDGI